VSGGANSWLGSGSIQKSLLRALAITTVSALALAAALLVATEMVQHRRAAETNLLALGSVIALYSEAPLAFNDSAAGSEALGALANVPYIDAAALYDTNGNRFATFGEARADQIVLGKPEPGIAHRASHMDLVQAIESEGRVVGYLVVRRSTADLGRALLAKLFAIGLATVGALIVAFALASRLGRHIARPLETQVAAFAAVAHGDLSIEVDDKGSGELGELARAFNTMTTGLRALISQVGQGVAEVVGVSRTLEERGGELGNASSRQAAAISEATDSVGRVGESIRSVNQSVEQLAETAEQTSGSTLEMDASIGEVTARMEDLTQAIAATSAAVAQVTTSIGNIAHSVETLQGATAGTAEHLGQLTRTVNSVAANAAESSGLSQESCVAAEQGMSVVREASSAMDSISKSFHSLERCVGQLSDRSTSIGEIVQVITAIADETKLLALNAAIIAAQAGESGAAFSVVAHEVRELADRTHRSAGDITDLIRATQEDTSAAVAAVEEGSARVAQGVERSTASAQVLQRILEKSTASAARTREIADATTRQASDLDRAGHAMREIDQAVQAIRQSTLEQQQSSEEIATRIESIRELDASVQQSMQQQRQGSTLISKAAVQISETLSEIVVATNAQSQSGETIESTLRVFSEVSAETVRSAEAITAAVSTLLKRAEWLARESQRFRIGSSTQPSESRV
jgi:methyl-accepting chemotaxis protein